MSSHHDLFQQTLRRHGYSQTAPRTLVFKLLQQDAPQSMHDLFKRGAGKLDRASLYRTIRVFEETGIAQRVNIGWKYKLELTDIFNHHHHHITCLGCGKLSAIHEDAEIEHLIRQIAAHHNITPTRHQLEIQGYCAACQSVIP